MDAGLSNRPCKCPRCFAVLNGLELSFECSREGREQERDCCKRMCARNVAPAPASACTAGQVLAFISPVK